MLSINFSELVLTIISFFLLLFLLNKFLYTPVLKFMRERQARVDASLEKERLAQEEASALEAQINADLAAKRDEAKADLAKQRAQDGKESDEYAKRLREESAQERRDAKARVEKEAEDVSAALDTQKTELARTLADRLLGK